MRNLCSLSSTRWTVRHRALSVIIEQLPEIIETLEVISNVASNAKVASEANGLLKLMTNFEFIFCLKFMFRVLSVTDFSSKELQSESLDILHLFFKLEALIDCLKGERNDNSLKLFWIETEELSTKLSSKGFNVGNPTLQRRRKVPKKLDYSSSNSAFFPESP